MPEDIQLNRKIYDEAFLTKQPCYEPFQEIIARLLRRRPTARAVDFGCGNGSLGKFLVELGQKPAVLHGVDISPTALQCARQYYDDVFLKDDYRLPPATYDLVVANSVLEHIDDAHLEILLNDVRAKLSPGGALFVVVPNVHSPKLLLFGNRDRDRREMGHVNLKTRREWIAFLRRLGFSRFQFSHFILLQHSDQIVYYPASRVLNWFARTLYPLFLASPFYRLRDSFYILVR